VAASAVDASGTDVCDGEDFHDDESSPVDNTWDVGEVLYVACQGDRDHTVLETTVGCDAKATA
jgi:hypothetical protein